MKIGKAFHKNIKAEAIKPKDTKNYKVYGLVYRGVVFKLENNETITVISKKVANK